VSGDRR